MARHHESDAFTAEDRRLIEELARRAAVVLDNGALYQDAQRAIAVRENVLRVVAHDLRNPFSTINLATSRLAQSAPRLPADLQEVPEVIKQCVRRGNQMIGDLLDTAQIAAGKLKVRAAPSAPARTISAVVATHRPLID